MPLINQVATNADTKMKQYQLDTTSAKIKLQEDGKNFTEWKEQVIALGYGSFYNHSETANAFWISNIEDRTFKFISNREIKKGEEIFVWYGDVNYWNDGRTHTNVI